MKLTTSKGKTYNADWADGPTIMQKALVIQLQDERKLAEIAEEFEGVKTIRRESEKEGNKEWTGYTELLRVSRTIKGVVTLSLIRPEQ